MSVLDLFDLKPQTPTSKPDGLNITSATGESSVKAVSKTALELDDWSIRRGEEALAESARLQKTKLDYLACADFFGSAFEPEPMLADSCVDELRHKYITQLLDTPEYHELHSMTMGDVLGSDIAAAHFAEQFCVLREQRELKKKRKPGKPGDKKDSEIDDELQTLRAVGRALNGAKEECDAKEDAARAFGLGEGAKGAGDAAAIAKVFNRVRNNPVLRRICELAGQFRRLMRSVQRAKVVAGLDDVVGITLGSELNNLVPAELLKFGMDMLEDDLIRRIFEEQAVVREYLGIEHVGKGPVVVVCDESGSMRGEPVASAKAIALTLCLVAREQNRWCALVAFSGGQEGRRLVLPPGKWDHDKLAEWLEAFLGGGTNLDCPLSELPNVYWNEFIAQGATRGRTDTIMITDAIVDAPDKIVNSFNAWRKAENVRVQTIVIGSEPGDLAKVSDECHRVEALSVEEEAVGKVLAI